uniref:Uncharacterized protein n=1 Tax=Nelumbo nucifera TaxID=4432 RepID=A0A822Y9Q4_NELNU|nr:TPA_asm: hypothetical protein HUJ06_029203 [Nelumbo nucifera]
MEQRLAIAGQNDAKTTGKSARKTLAVSFLQVIRKEKMVAKAVLSLKSELGLCFSLK